MPAKHAPSATPVPTKASAASRTASRTSARKQAPKPKPSPVSKPATAKPAVKPTKAKRKSSRTGTATTVRRASTTAPRAAATAPPTPVASLSAQIRAAIAARHLSINAAAREIGVTATSVHGVVQSGADPNRRTRRRYLAWLKSGPVKAPARAASAKPARKTAPKPRKAATVASTAATDLAPLLRLPVQRLLALAAQAQHPAPSGIDRDALAQRVHAASKAQRAVIDTLLSTLG